MNIYLFSSHTPDPKMLKDLGVPIKAQFRGCISDVHARGEQISFTETLYIGGQTIKTCPTIPRNSIVVVEAPPVLQGSWLAAGVNALLIPQMKQEVDHREHHTFTYCGLIQVHKIEIQTSPWSSQAPDDQEPDQAASDGQLDKKHEPAHPSRVAGLPPVAHMFVV